MFAAEILPSSEYSRGEDDPVVGQLLEKYSDEIGSAEEILGTNGRYRNKENICQLVADLYYAAGVEKWRENYQIVLGGGYISCRSPGYLPTGEVSYGQLLSLLPFDNQIMLCSISGRNLISRFLETDNSAYYICTTAQTADIDPDGVYYLVTDSYTANYSYNRLTIIDTFDANVFARDLLANYIRQGALG